MYLLASQGLHFAEPSAQSPVELSLIPVELSTTPSATAQYAQ